MTAIRAMIQEIQRALEKTDPQEREIALRVVEEQQNKRLQELESSAKEQALKVVDGMILDCMSAPGMPGQYLGCSQQEVLVILRHQLGDRLSVDYTNITVDNISERLRQRNVLARPRDPRHEQRKTRTGKGG